MVFQYLTFCLIVVLSLKPLFFFLISIATANGTIATPILNTKIPDSDITSISTTNTQKSLKILAVTGSDHENNLNDVEYFDPFTSNNNCKKKPDYPDRVRGACGDQNLFCGGYNGDYSNKCFKLENDVWTERSSLIEGRINMPCSYLNNGSFWVVGGINLSLSADKNSEILVNDDSEFQKSCYFPNYESLANHCMAKINQTHLFIAGGDYFYGAYIVDTAQETFAFTELPRPKVHRALAACGRVNNPLYSENADGEQLLILVGGSVYPPSPMVFKTSEIFSTSTNQWMEGPLLPRGFKDGGYYSDEQNSLILVGGEDENGELRSDVLAYNNELNTFETLPSMLKIARRSFPITGVYNEEDC